MGLVARVRTTTIYISKYSKGIPVRGREGPWGCETSSLPHYLEDQLIDGGKVVSPTRRPSFTPQENYLINSWYSFLLEAEPTPGP
jgi:hypothetical protein